MFVELLLSMPLFIIPDAMYRTFSNTFLINIWIKKFQLLKYCLKVYVRVADPSVWSFATSLTLT